MGEIKTEHVICRPEVCGGRACIAGTRIRVQDIYVWHELQVMSAAEIASRFEQISMADVYAALAYFWDHRDEMQRQMREEAAFVEQMKLKHPSLLRDKLAGTNAQNNPVPS